MGRHAFCGCPHYPQPYDDGDDAPLLWVGALGTRPEEDHNKHSLKWYNFLGELPYLPTDVANHPRVRGRRGSPNVWQIPEDLHIEMHRGPGGGPYNQRWIEEIAAIRARGREVMAHDVLEIREKLVVEFGLEAYRP